MKSVINKIGLFCVVSLCSMNVMAADCPTLDPLAAAAAFVCNTFSFPCPEATSDDDMDNVDFEHEQAAGTNYLCADTDEDGISDADELGDEFINAAVTTETIAALKEDKDEDGDGTIDALDSCNSTIPVLGALFCFIANSGDSSDTNTVVIDDNDNDSDTVTEPTPDDATQNSAVAAPQVFSSGGAINVWFFLMLGLLFGYKLRD